MKFTVDLATTPDKLAQGLMFRRDMPHDHGMLFIFSQVMPLSFWGRNTFIPLDIAFIDRDGRVADVGKIKPMREVGVRSIVPCLMAVELNDGAFEKHGVEVGDLMVMDQVSAGTMQIEFIKDDGEARNRVIQRYSQNKQKPLPKIHSLLTYAQMQQSTEDPMPDWMQEARSTFLPSKGKINAPRMQPPQPTGHDFSGDQDQPDPDDSSLPLIPLSQIMSADDDENEYDGMGDEEKAPMNPDNYNAQQGDEATEQAPPPKQAPPDPRKMSVGDALEYGEKNGLVMWINYRVSSQKKKKVGMTPQRNIHRIIQPHGSFMAQSTGNDLEVTWDMSVNDFRAFIKSQITAKGYTGQTFKKWFRVSP